MKKEKVNCEIVEKYNLSKNDFAFTEQNKTIHDTKFETKPVGYLHDCFKRFVKNKASVVAGILLLIIALFAIFEPVLDPRSYVSYSDYPNGFQDKNFAEVLPRVDMFKGSGFWDGTEVKTIGEIDYNLYRYTDSNYEKITFLEKINSYIEIGPIKVESTKYKVRWDTYAIGNKEITLSKKEFDALVSYEKEKGIYGESGSIIKPFVDHDTYLKEASAKLINEGVDQATTDRIIDQMGVFYTQNPFVYYELMPSKIKDKYVDNQFVPVLDANEKPIDIYMLDENGQKVNHEINNGEYSVRVDYFDYFTYKNGFTPIYVFGANQSGQDIFLRLALGARFSLLLGIGVSLINFLIGLVWGAISGYYGGRTDLIMERITDIIVNVPTIIIMTICQIQLMNNLALKSVLGPTGVLIFAIFIAFIYNGWVGVSATTRMQFYRFKGQEYVLASRTLGAKDRRLIFKHILPNAAGTLVTGCVLMIPGVIFAESSLSYLGIIDFSATGLASIGTLLAEGQAAGIANNPHVLLFPALLISLLMICFNLFGNGLRDAFNTTLRGSED